MKEGDYFHMDYLPKKQKPRINMIERNVAYTRHFIIKSVTGIPSFTRKPKMDGIHATAQTSLYVALSLNIRNWCKDIASQPWNTKSINIMESHRFDFVYGLTVAEKWFDVNEIPDLFMKINDDELAFNHDYNYIGYSIPIETKARKQMISLVPAVIHLGEKDVEGIRLFINNRYMYGELTLLELKKVINLFAFFNYQIEGIYNIQVLTNGIEIQNPY